MIGDQLAGFAESVAAWLGGVAEEPDSDGASDGLEVEPSMSCDYDRSLERALIGFPSRVQPQ